MNKTKIEWCDYTWNPIKGLCPYACEYCYARRIYKRFKWNPQIRYDKKEHFFNFPQKPSKIFVGSMIDLFHPKIPGTWIDRILAKCRAYPEHKFIFLTKNPERYRYHRFSINCWIGTTITGFLDWSRTTQLMFFKKDNPRNIVFISIEPLLENCDSTCVWYGDWVIMGGLSPKIVHKKEWVDFVINKCRKENIPIFLKSNLHYPKKIQEFPVCP